MKTKQVKTTEYTFTKKEMQSIRWMAMYCLHRIAEHDKTGKVKYMRIIKTAEKILNKNKEVYQRLADYDEGKIKIRDIKLNE